MERSKQRHDVGNSRHSRLLTTTPCGYQLSRHPHRAKQIDITCARSDRIDDGAWQRSPTWNRLVVGRRCRSMGLSTHCSISHHQLVQEQHPRQATVQHRRIQASMFEAASQRGLHIH
jgi:hypothetical protein